MGRLNHLQETLPQNLCGNQGFEGLEFVLLDYSSRDGLAGWIKARFMPEIKSGLLVYYRAEGYQRFFMAHAKNVAHRLARGQIVCNVDADNFIGWGFAEHLWKLLGETGPDTFAYSRGARGTSGRIALWKSSFETLGGYDEGMGQGWGYEDKDLVSRARRAGLRAEPIGNEFLKALPHSDTLRVRHGSEKDRRHSNSIHRGIAREHVAQNCTVANLNRSWGTSTVKKNFSAMPAS